MLVKHSMVFHLKRLEFGNIYWIQTSLPDRWYMRASWSKWKASVQRRISSSDSSFSTKYAGSNNGSRTCESKLASNGRRSSCWALIQHIRASKTYSSYFTFRSSLCKMASRDSPGSSRKSCCFTTWENWEVMKSWALDLRVGRAWLSARLRIPMQVSSWIELLKKLAHASTTRRNCKRR